MGVVAALLRKAKTAGESGTGLNLDSVAARGLLYRLLEIVSFFNSQGTTLCRRIRERALNKNSWQLCWTVELASGTRCGCVLART